MTENYLLSRNREALSSLGNKVYLLHITIFIYASLTNIINYNIKIHLKTRISYSCLTRF